MSTLLRESLEARLVTLEDLRLDVLGDPEVPDVCATCYALKDECYCPNPVFWPLPAVVYKLRAELSAPESDSFGTI